MPADGRRTRVDRRHVGFIPRDRHQRKNKGGRIIPAALFRCASGSPWIGTQAPRAL